MTAADEYVPRLASLMPLAGFLWVDRRGLTRAWRSGPPAQPGSHPKTDDLLNVAKALLVWVATQALRHRWSDDQLPTDLAPQNAPQRETLIGSAVEFCV